MEYTFFTDPRFGRERIFLVLVLPLVILLLAGVVAFLYFKSVEKPLEPEVLPASIPYVQIPPDFIKEAKQAIQTGDYPAAKEALAKISLDAEKSPAAWEMAGLIQENEGQTAAAFDTYSNGIEAAPSAGLHYRRAIILRNWDNFPASLHDINAANVLNPHDPLYTNERFLTLIQLGLQEDVRNQLADLLTTGVNLDASEWIFAVALIALNNNQPSDATAALHEAKISFPPDHFHKLLSHPAFAPYLNLPEIMPLTIRNSNN